MLKKLLTTTYIIASLSTGTVFAVASTPPTGATSAMAIETNPTAQNSAAIINQIMSVSGMDEMIEQLPAGVAMGFDQQPPPPVNQAEYERFRQAYLQTFDPVKIRQTVVDHFSRHYEPQRFAELLEVLNTPLALKMKALEVQANTPQAQQEMMQMGNIIMGQASPSRLALVQQLDAAQKATETMIDVQLMTTRAMMEGMNTLAPPEQQVTKEQQGQMLEQLRAQSLYPARQFVYLSLVYTYRTVSDEELGEYLRLYQSELGRWSTTLMMDAWMNVADDVSQRLAGLMKSSYIKNNAL